MTGQYFNFHNIVGMKVTTSDQSTQSFFTQELGDFAAGPLLENPKVMLHWSSSAVPELRPGSGRYVIHKMLARWRYSIRWDHQHVRLDVLGNRMAIPMVHHMLAQPSMRYLASQEGFMMIHGAALAHNGRSILVTGPGGTGKTTVSSLLLAGGDPGWQFQSDDYAFLGPGPTSYSFPARAHLYRDILNWQPEIVRRLSTPEKIGLHIFGALREWSHDGVTWPVRVEINRLWPDRTIIPEADLAAIILLSRAGSEIQLTRIKSDQQQINELIAMNFHEARQFITLLEGARVTPDGLNWLTEWRLREANFIRQRMEDTAFYRLRLPVWGEAENDLGKELEDVLLPLITGEGRQP